MKQLRDSSAIIPDDVHFVTVCDREGDFYELYAEANVLEMGFVIRVTHDRCSDTDERIATKIRQTKALGNVVVKIPRDSRKVTKAREAVIEVASCRVNIMKPTNAHDEETCAKIGYKSH